LLDLSIYWPGYSSGEWQILPGSTRLISGKTSVPLSPQESETETDVLQMTFRERQSGEFIVEFRAYAPLAAVRSGKIQLRCPEIQGRLGQPFVLTTIESDQYSIRPISMGTGRPLPTVPLPVPHPTVAVEPGLQSESWLHDDPSIPVRLELPEQAPSVRANLRLGMQQRGAAIEVKELINFEIEHRDLPALSLNVPAEIRKPTVRIAGQTEVLRATIDSDTHWSFRLPEARRGSLTIEVNYIWTPALLSDPLPLILPEAAEIQSIEVGTESGSGLTVEDSESWRPVYSERFDAAWLMSMLQRITAVIPLLFIGCTALVGWLILPEWTALLAPYAAMGILFGTVSVFFQRMVSDRRIRFPQASQVGEYPTIFGFSGMLSHSGNERSEPVVTPSGTKSEFNVSSFV
jgi:hypothetical protein